MIFLRIFKPTIKGIYEATLSNIPWAPPGVALIGAARMWPYTKGEGTVVAVLDTGIDYTHPDLKSNVIGGASFVPSESDFLDENGHGTHVAGTIAANGAILGVAPEAKLLGVKVLDKSGVGSINNISQGLSWARKWKGKNGERVNVVNFSLGSSLANSFFHNEIKKAVHEGITIVCAAGNEGDGKPDTIEISYPAYYSETVAVGAINLETGIADFSNSNQRIDVVAPGIDTYSTFIGGRYVELSGTSMASPHVAGAVALIYSRYFKKFSVYPNPANIKDFLHYQAIDLSTVGFNNLYGYGLFTFTVDGGKAITLIVGENKYFINDRSYYFKSPLFIKDNVVMGSVEEVCNLLNTNTLFVPPNKEGENQLGLINIWY